MRCAYCGAKGKMKKDLMGWKSCTVCGTGGQGSNN